jgi:hypothetical protein
LFCSGFFLLACDVLRLETIVPDGFDLSGDWELIADESDPAPQVSELRRQGLAISFATQDFPVLSAQAMTIEQNADSMGVQFDQGMYRDVTWGKRVRGLWDINVGWDGGTLYIISKANDASAKESMRLEDGGERLAVSVRIEAEGESFSANRIYRRVYLP